MQFIEDVNFDRIYRDVRTVLYDYAGVQISTEDVKVLFAQHMGVIELAALWGSNDTEVRGMICNVLSQHLLGKAWPIYGDNINIDSFYEELHNNALTKGYNVV